MDYRLDAEPGRFGIVGKDVGDNPKQRILDCEKEIAAVLEKYGCILIISTAAKAKE